MFMKIYHVTAVCGLAGGVDRKTLDKWVWGNAEQHGFIEAISMLEPMVVRFCASIVVFESLIFLLTPHCLVVLS